MSQFIQLHLLTAYPPSNLNRDDLGRPKTAIMGGSERLRVSSQSLKRAWRTSDIFEAALGEYKGKRTKRLGREVHQYLIDKGVAEKEAKDWAQKIAAQFGKLEGLDIAQLAHIAPKEEQAVYELADALVSESRAPNDDELNLLHKRPKAVDIALFGRMLASSTQHNVEAAVQVAHAISVNAVKIEDDFFTAVDDLNKHDEDAGAGHMGDASFGSGIFYQYICINKTALVDNLQGDEALANKAIKALTETAAKVAPTGKQNSFASRAYTSCLLAEKGSQQPRALSVAFLKAIRADDPMNAAIKALLKQRGDFETVYGQCADEFKLLNVHDPEQSAGFEDVLNFVVA